jgi:hypothetical protein
MLMSTVNSPMLAAGEAIEFRPVCDDVEHIGTTAGDAQSLIQPAWFLAKTAVEKFPSGLALPGAALSDLKKQLERAVGALELHLAFIANKPEGTLIDPFAFRDVCHLAQTVWFTTGVIEPGIPDLVELRARLAAQSVRLAEDFATRREVANFSFAAPVFWGLLVGGAGYWWWHRKRKKEAAIAWARTAQYARKRVA